jgi:hypothetical protein
MRFQNAINRVCFVGHAQARCYDDSRCCYKWCPSVPDICMLWCKYWPPMLYFFTFLWISLGPIGFCYNQ